MQRRIEGFSRGEWASLLASAQESTSRGAQAFSRRRRVTHDDLESRAAWAEALVQMEELSSARQAFEGAAVLLGNGATLTALQNPSRRPSVLRDPSPDDILNVVLICLLVLDREECARNVRSAKRGAAGGPSGTTAEHLRGAILKSEVDRHVRSVSIWPGQRFFQM